ncbi:S8 family peptidase [Solwaraspora sp. WMMD406]|uniref:S8 family peptidase n=1 Tax=Solwaraspora sp. WMMD406 TaxID=3016095 RepID=UPI002415FE60|nr:S8 family peptidase [Solwaraspora sp. WMMD406]MDG4768350.1 S8 family peptidase [Solwaraspora sp. WMMD406]
MNLSRVHWRRLAAAGVATTMLAALAGSPAAAAPPTGEIRQAVGAQAVPNSYVVVLKDSAVGGRAGTRQATVRDLAAKLTTRYGGSTGQIYGDALNGFEARLSELAARRLAANPAVAYVEENHVVRTTVTQFNPPWGLDRIDQLSLPLSGTYSWVSQGTGVTAYIIDTGIRITHPEFGGQAVYGINAVTGGTNADDCNGHGTHVAGTVGATTYGVAKDVKLVAVKVLDCVGAGTLTSVITGVNWVTANHLPGQPAVANMSLGGSYSSSLNATVNNSINDGVTYVVAAGNSAANACNYSPASVPAAITVGATQANDAQPAFSNWGPCVDIRAPGVGILSTWIGPATNTLSGTSMAAPHVAGAAARVLQINPGWPPAQVHAFLVGTAGPTGIVYLPPIY